jgi:hypothetical protein
VSFQCFGERPDGGQTDDVTYGHAPARLGHRGTNLARNLDLDLFTGTAFGTPVQVQ